MNQTGAIAVLVNTGSEEEALTIARAVVEERLAVCANLIPNIRSVYRWQDKVEDESECAMIIKTVSEQLPALTKRVVELHSYDCPEVIALPIVDGHAPYLDWVRENSQS